MQSEDRTRNRLKSEKMKTENNTHNAIYSMEMNENEKKKVFNRRTYVCNSLPTRPREIQNANIISCVQCESTTTTTDSVPIYFAIRVRLDQNNFYVYLFNIFFFFFVLFLFRSSNNFVMYLTIPVMPLCAVYIRILSITFFFGRCCHFNFLFSCQGKWTFQCLVVLIYYNGSL